MIGLGMSLGKEVYEDQCCSPWYEAALRREQAAAGVALAGPHLAAAFVNLYCKGIHDCAAVGGG